MFEREHHHFMADTVTSPVADETTGMTQCPHCRKQFQPVVDHGQPPRLQGAKCPHCRLFVPVRLISNDEPIEVAPAKGTIPPGAFSATRRSR